jgi:AcrR family transcriptional regulator
MASEVAGKKRGKQKPKRKRLSAGERKADIIQAAQRVFVRKGYHSARTKDLAEEAGVNVATLFLHFDTKQAMFDAAITEPLKALIETQIDESQAFALAGDAGERARVADKAIKEMLEGVIEASPLLITALFAGADNDRDAYRKALYPLIKKLRKSTRTNLKLEDDWESEFVVVSAFGLCLMMNFHHEMIGKDIDIDKISGQISSLLTRGVVKLEDLS